MSTSSGKVDGRRGNVSDEAWRAGWQQARDRLLVLLACAETESECLRVAWVGQTVDLLHCADLGAALVLVGQSAPDMVVVGQSGCSFGPVDFLRALRQVDTSTPVIVGLDESVVPQGSEVLAAGATAIVRRPFSPVDLLRLLDSSVPHGRFRVRPLPIELGRLRVEGASPRMWVDGVESVIPPMEFMLLRLLAERHGEIVSRDELVSAGWGQGTAVPSNSLSVHMARLRRRLDGQSGQDWIRSLRGFGYQLVVPTCLDSSSTPQASSMR